MGHFQDVADEVDALRRLGEAISELRPSSPTSGVWNDVGNAVARAYFELRDYMNTDEQRSDPREVDTKDMSTLMEIAKLLGQIGTAGAAMYVGAGAARETYDALKAKCREMMDKLDEAQRQLDDIDPRELDAEMRSAPRHNSEKDTAMADSKGILDRILGAFGNDGAVDRNVARREIAQLQRERDEMRSALDRLSSADHYSGAWDQAKLILMDGIRELDNAIADAQIALDNEERSDPRPVDVKAAGAYDLYR